MLSLQSAATASSCKQIYWNCNWEVLKWKGKLIEILFYQKCISLAQITFKQIPFQYNFHMQLKISWDHQDNLSSQLGLSNLKLLKIFSKWSAFYIKAMDLEFHHHFYHLIIDCWSRWLLENIVWWTFNLHNWNKEHSIRIRLKLWKVVIY